MQLPRQLKDMNVFNAANSFAGQAMKFTRPKLVIKTEDYRGAGMLGTVKLDMGLEAIEEIEVVAADLACRVFGARFAEVRVGSGALANLYGFMATCAPGDTVLVPPPTIGGHVTHNRDGAAGLYGLDIREYPIDPGRRSSRSARASTCCRIRWPRCVPSPTRSGRSCSTTGRTPAACSPAAAGRCRWPRVPTCSP